MRKENQVPIPYFFLNASLQVVVYLFFLNQFFHVNNLKVQLHDYLFFIGYGSSLFFGIRILVIAPIYYLLKKNWSHYLPFIAAFIESFLLVFTVVDCIAYSDQGVHLYDSIVIRTIKNPDFLREVNIGISSFMILGLVWTAIIAVQIQFWKFLTPLNKNEKINSLTTYGISTVFLFLFTSSVAYSPTYFNKLGESATLFPYYLDSKPWPLKPQSLLVNYQYPPTPKLTKESSIIFIMTESLRSDMATSQYMPKLKKFVEENSCLSSQYHYSGGHTTEYGVFTALYGLYGIHYTDFAKQKLPSYGIKILKDNGYKIEGGTASQLSRWMGAGFMFDIFDNYLEFKSPIVENDDSTMTMWAIDRLQDVFGQGQKNNKEFIFLFYNSTHHSYHYPKEFEKFTPALEENFNQMNTQRNDPNYQKRFFNRYRNSVGWVDHNMGDLFSTITRLKKENKNFDPIIVVTGDHGEEFWEEGLLGHSKTNYINPRVQVPLFICNSKIAPNKIVALSSHPDIFPTIIDLLKPKNEVTQFNGLALLDPQLDAKRKYVVITAPQFPYENSKMALITKSNKFWLKNENKKIDQLELVRSTDINDNSVDINQYSTSAEGLIQTFTSEAFKFLKVSPFAQ